MTISRTSLNENGNGWRLIIISQFFIFLFKIFSTIFSNPIYFLCNTQVMIFLVDYVLPRNYFSNNLRALSVDMAVLRDLMQMKLPYLARHLQQLQKEAMDVTNNTTASYEPPLINMFTMQWFLTLFATCLPRNTVLRIWDAALLEGSEVLLRVALAIWAKLGKLVKFTFKSR